MKNQKGITLVALVVTIVVLLILAGITIALVMNPDSSIFGNARKAETETNSGSVKELVSTAFAAAETNYFTRDTKVYDGVTDFLSEDAAKKFTADLAQEASKLGATFNNLDVNGDSGDDKKKVNIETNGESEAPKTFKGFKLDGAEVTYGNKTFTVNINTSSDTPEGRITVTEGVAAAE